MTLDEATVGVVEAARKFRSCGDLSADNSLRVASLAQLDVALNAYQKAKEEETK